MADCTADYAKKRASLKHMHYRSREAGQPAVTMRLEQQTMRHARTGRVSVSTYLKLSFFHPVSLAS